MSHSDVRQLLEGVRREAGLTQGELARRMDVHQSRVSRLESSEGSPSLEESIAYLRAVGSSNAKKLRAALETRWAHLAQPSFRHPDLQTLIEAEASLGRLDDFKSGPSIPHVLAGQADLLFRRLYGFAEFLLKLDHKVVYVGEIGVGKTTAACKQAGLVIDPAAPDDLKGTMLDTGGGRTTLCDVHVEAGERFSLEVEPVPDTEIYRLVDEFCRSVISKAEFNASAAKAMDFKLPEEVERALRAMANLPRPSRRKGVPSDPDPAAQLGQRLALEEFKAEVATRLTLWRRNRRSIEFDGSDHLAGRRWLRDTFTRINSGRHEDFSLPARITVTVPIDLMPGSTYNVRLLDTRGIDGSAIRPDILTHLNDPRALTVLCAKWGSAPEPSLQDLLRHVVETEVDPALLSRVAILVVARSGDALAMRHDSGESAQDAVEGYEIKRTHVEDALHKSGMGSIAIEAFDAATDRADDLSQFLNRRISQLRAAQADHARATMRAIDEMLSNIKKAQALETLRIISDDLSIFTKEHAKLKARSKPVYARLISAVQVLHARTVWAATRRDGEFWNFDVYQHLGDGAAAEAKRRSTQPINGLRELINNRAKNDKYKSAHAFLEQLLDNVNAWEADFVKAVRHHAITIFKPALLRAQQLWTTSEGLYGQGINYRDEVAREMERWFEENEDLQDALERYICDAWRASVLNPLRDAAGGVTSRE